MPLSRILCRTSSEQALDDRIRKLNGTDLRLSQSLLKEAFAELAKVDTLLAKDTLSKPSSVNILLPAMRKILFLLRK